MAQITASPAKAQHSLNGSWEIAALQRGEGYKLEIWNPSVNGGKWLNAQVPGTVQADLLRLGRAPDPFFHKNVDDYRCLETKEWWYRKTFVLPDDFKSKQIFLQFEGVDTLGTFYLNGHPIGRHENMFTPCEFDITRIVKFSRENLLMVSIDAPIPAAKERDTRGVIDIVNQRHHKDDWHTAAYIRKANFAYGGDMSQRMITVGIWRGVKIVGYEKARIDACQITSHIIDNRRAEVDVSVDITKYVCEPLPLQLKIQIRDKNGKTFSKTATLRLERKDGCCTAALEISNPQLWWPNGMGTQSLYDIRVELRSAKRCLDVWEDRFGIREIKLRQPKDTREGGRKFIIQVNGVNVFAKGANWVPAEPLMHPVDIDRYRTLLQAARSANMNMFRVNGFGIYEDEEFYRLCDENGIMIWQDFMFSDCFYPDDDDEFLWECEKEATVVVKRLRNHPSIVLWCGNNEVDEIYYTGAFDSDPDIWWIWGEKIFHQILPQVCRELDPTRPYWPSSAWSSPGAWPLSPKEGDIHFYTWSKAEFRQIDDGPFGETLTLPLTFESLDYRRYAQYKAKFYSEFGQRSVPEASTLRRIMPSQDIWPPNHDTWVHHSVGSDWKNGGFEKMNLLIGEFTDPDKINTIEEYAFYSQLAQASALKFAIENFRVRKFSCAGSLFWQFNDCWPASTYSVIDYYLNRKIAYYWVKKAYQPVLICFIPKSPEQLEIWMVNDLPTAIHGGLSFQTL